MADPAFEVHPEAIAEAQAARRWYAERDPRAAEAFLTELDRAQAQVAATPDRWPAHLHGTQRFRLRRFPYLLVYHAIPDRIIVLAVAHAKRRPGYWKDRQQP